jgi:hypothetical protein
VVIGAEAALPDQTQSFGRVAVGEQQPGPLGRHRVEEVHHGRVGHGPVGLLEGIQGALLVILSVADPGQRDQAGGQRRGVGERAAEGDPGGGMLQGRAEPVAFVEHLGHADLGHAGGRQGWLARLAGQLQPVLVSAQGRAQAALGLLEVGEIPAGPHGQVALAGRGPVAHHLGQAALGRLETPTQPVGHGQVVARERAQLHPVLLGQLGQGLPGEGSLALGVAAQPGQVRPADRRHRREIGQDAGGPADRRLVRLLTGAAGRLLDGVQERLGLLGAAAKQRRERLAEAEPWPRADNRGGQGGQPPGHGRALAAA